MEYINATKVSPLISHVQIKVCYVGQDPNRNGTVITKETATKLAQGLPGCPIVGYYNEKTGDFEAHNKEVVVEGKKFKLVDMTKPYGFVDIGAKVWFQKFMDDGIEHEYLCTEGYIWTEIYEESKRVTEQGNNQSMELNEKYEKGFWTKDDNSGRNIFIINDGLIEKLCILGYDVEPCFEGAQIKSFAFTRPEFNEFKSTMFSMIQELKDALSNEGGSKEAMENENKNPQAQEETNPSSEFEKKKDNPEEKKDNKQEEKKDNTSPEDKKKKKEEEEDYSCGGDSGGNSNKKKKDYDLNQISEYVALQLQFNELQTKYAALEQEHQTLIAEVNDLRAFKLSASRKEKEDMIASFYMLSDKDKEDVVNHIDTYSLNDIEAKLSIICVRNKVDFNFGKENQNDENKSTQQYMLNLQNRGNNETDNAPAWVKAVRAKSN